MLLEGILKTGELDILKEFTMNLKYRTRNNSLIYRLIGCKMEIFIN